MSFPSEFELNECFKLLQFPLYLRSPSLPTTTLVPSASQPSSSQPQQQALYPIKQKQKQKRKYTKRISSSESLQTLTPIIPVNKKLKTSESSLSLASTSTVVLPVKEQNEGTQVSASHQLQLSSNPAPTKAPASSILPHPSSLSSPAIRATVTRSRSNSPTFAEMKFFLERVHASQLEIAAIDLPPPRQKLSHERQNALSALGRTTLFVVVTTLRNDREAKEKLKADKEAAEIAAKVYQLSRIDSTLSSNQKRLAIIHALECITLSILKQLIDSVPRPLDVLDDQVPIINQEGVGRSKEKRKSVVAKTKPVVIVLAKRTGGNYDPTAAAITPFPTRRIVFPRRAGHVSRSDLRCGAREVAAFLKTVELILVGLKRQQVVTKRDLFYRCVALFVVQATVDNIVEDIAATLGVRRGDLNVVAASKGLFAGSLKIVSKDGSTLEGGFQGALIPPTQTIERLECDPAVEWILIIEKEAVFHSLRTPEFLQHPSLGRGILLTGKGYPDLATRELVKRLDHFLPLVPILILVDSDPHGIEIMSTYRFGSSAMAFDREHLAVDRIEWLGIKASEWDSSGVNREELLTLGKADRKKAAQMVRREWWPREWKRELSYMLHLGKKSEIQIMASVASSSTTDSTANAITEVAKGDTVIEAESRLISYLVRKINARLSH